jgi:CHAT domain-containing protein
MSDVERQQLEDVLAGHAYSGWRPEAVMGRLAQLYLAERSSPRLARKSRQLIYTALQSIGVDDPLYPKLRHLQAMEMRSRKSAKKSSTVLSQALEFDREAWKISLEMAPREAIMIATEWGDWAWERERWEDASEAYFNAHRAARRVVLRHVSSVPDRLTALNNIKSATRGAYAFAKIENVQEAIVLLERASELLSAANQQVRDLQRLAKNSPENFAQLIEAAESVRLLHKQHGLDEFGNLSLAEREAQRQLDKLVFTIRTLPQMASFALPSNWSVIQEAAEITPLVYLIPTDKGCFCFLIWAGGNQAHTSARLMELQLTDKEISTAASGFVRAEHEHHPERTDQLLQLLQWLGLRTMGWVRTELEKLGLAEKPITIIPYGIFALLPMHATCMERQNPTGLHFFFHPKHVRYAYSARNVVESRERSANTNLSAALVINNPTPTPPTFDPLELSDFESQVVERHFQGQVLAGAKATTKKVCELLPAAKIVHFSCHGDVDNRIQYSGVLLLAHGQELSPEQIFQIPNFFARLVVLSACRSGSPALGIEFVLNLPAAFLAAGAAAVLGTFWHADEIASLLLLTRFYDLWKHRQCAPIEALGLAQEWLMYASADTLKAAIPAEALASPAAKILTDAAPADVLFSHPWYWAGFFVAGA